MTKRRKPNTPRYNAGIALPCPTCKVLPGQQCLKNQLRFGPGTVLETTLHFTRYAAASRLQTFPPRVISVCKACGHPLRRNLHPRNNANDYVLDSEQGRYVHCGQCSSCKFCPRPVVNTYQPPESSSTNPEWESYRADLAMEALATMQFGPRV